MTILYVAILLLLFLGVAFAVRRFLPILIALVVLVLVLVVSISLFGFMPDYSRGMRAGVVQKYSVKGIIFKSGEITMVLPVEGMVMTSDPITVFIVSCMFSKTPDDCQVIEQAVATRQKIVVEYEQWLVKPIMQDSDYTVKSAKVVPAVAPATPATPPAIAPAKP
ncbi:MAG: hypothetical protein QM529_01125 [Hydrotalea sp.]|nr:hypothetical protein [Hydrotalea sp.]